MRSVRPETAQPPDFEQFWAETKQELAVVDPALSVRPKAMQPVEIHFRSLSGQKVVGYYAQASPEAPTIVHAHGYGSSVQPRLDWLLQGANVLGIDIRGCGRSVMATTLHSGGYILTGVGAPESSILRGAVCDYQRALEVAGQLATGPVTSYGFSFAGGLAVIAAGVWGTAYQLTVGVPTFGWSAGRELFVNRGSGAEITRYLSTRPHKSQDVALVLSYFDAALHARNISAPTLVGVGLVDDVVPPETVFAVVNHLGCPHRVIEFPVSHSDLPAENQWAEFDSLAINWAINGSGLSPQ